MITFGSALHTVCCTSLAMAVQDFSVNVVLILPVLKRRRMALRYGHADTDYFIRMDKGAWGTAMFPNRAALST